MFLRFRNDGYLTSIKVSYVKLCIQYRSTVLEEIQPLTAREQCVWLVNGSLKLLVVVK